MEIPFYQEIKQGDMGHNVLYLLLSRIIFVATAALLLALDVVDVVIPLVDRGVQSPLLLVTLDHTRRSLGRVREGSAKEVAALLSKTFFTSSPSILVRGHKLPEGNKGLFCDTLGPP